MTVPGPGVEPCPQRPDDRGWRATFYTTGMEHSPTSATGTAWERTPCFESAVERAGIKDFHFHDLRHTFASWFTMRGGSLYALQKILGHADIKMTTRYAHLAPDLLRSEMAKTEFSTRSTQSPTGAAQVPVAITGG